MNRGLLRSTAAASVLTALGSRVRGVRPGREGPMVCPSCGTACALEVARRDGSSSALEPDGPAARGAGCPRALRVPGALAAAGPPGAAEAPIEGGTTVAGLVLVTRAGDGPRGAARLARAPGLTLAGGDGDARIAVICELDDPGALDVLAERLLADPGLVGVHLVFIGEATR